MLAEEFMKSILNFMGFQKNGMPFQKNFWVFNSSIFTNKQSTIVIFAMLYNK